jgi:hypothetical protein
MPFRFLKRREMTAARFAGFWSTRNNHGLAQERRVCVLTKAPEEAERSRKRKCPPDGQFFGEGGEKAWSRDDVVLRCRFPHV